MLFFFHPILCFCSILNPFLQFKKRKKIVKSFTIRSYPPSQSPSRSHTLSPSIFLVFLIGDDLVGRTQQSVLQLIWITRFKWSLSPCLALCNHSKSPFQQLSNTTVKNGKAIFFTLISLHFFLIFCSICCVVVFSWLLFMFFIWQWDVVSTV